MSIVNPFAHDACGAKPEREIKVSIEPPDLCFRTYNAGQGAFHALSFGEDFGWWVVDCGTLRGAEKLGASVRAFKETISSETVIAFPMIVLSHYHKDHWSGFREIGHNLEKESLASGKYSWSLHDPESPEIWTPKIDEHSMNLYLTILAFATFFRNGRKWIEDRDLTAIFSRRRRLQEEVWHEFPEYRVVEKHAGQESRVLGEEQGCRVRVLSPPRFDEGKGPHPLLDDVDFIRRICRDSEVSSLLKKTIAAMLFQARDHVGFRMRMAQDEELHAHIANVRTYADRLLRVLRAGPPASPFLSVGMLQSMLVIALYASITSRLSVGRSSSPLSEYIRPTLSEWRRKVEDATHLFNLSLLFDNGAGTRFLLTGDADRRLWPCILSELAQIEAHEFTAVQVPHHGSERNIEPAVYDMFGSTEFVVSADAYRSWEHPSAALGKTIREARSDDMTGRLYCTNRHQNCGIRKSGNCGNVSLIAVEIGPEGVAWMIPDGSNVAACPCPHVR